MVGLYAERECSVTMVLPWNTGADEVVVTARHAFALLRRDSITCSYGRLVSTVSTVAKLLPCTVSRNSPELMGWPSAPHAQRNTHSVAMSESLRSMTIRSLV